MLDAPISGGAIGAQSGRLAVMVGGPREAYSRLKEPYKLTAEMLVHAGDEVGAGTKMKLARNLLHFIAFTATHRGGIAPRRGRWYRYHQAGQGGSAHRLDHRGRRLDHVAREHRSDQRRRFLVRHLRSGAYIGREGPVAGPGGGQDLGVDLPLGEIALRDFAAAIGVPHTEGESA